MVDRAEHRGRIIGIHEGAGAVVDGLAGDGGVVGVHHAMDEADMQPARDQRRLPRDHLLQQRAVGLRRRRGRRVVPGDGIVGQQPHPLHIAAGGEILEGADAEVAGGDAGQHGAGERGFAPHRLAGRHRGQRPGGRHAERRHRLADQVFAQHRAERRPAVALRENGVGPEPFSWMSRRRPSRPTTSPSRMARPSPSCGTKWPNWCPA